MKQLTKALVQRTMEAELTGRLGYEKHDRGEKPMANRRNGKPPKR
jgi:transposase-like protein